MATFTAGSTVTLTLDSDDTVTWVGSGQATITPASGPAWGMNLEGNQTFGPFGQSVTVSVVTRTAGSYTQNGYFADRGAPVYAVPSPVTGVIEISSDIDSIVNGTPSGKSNADSVVGGPTPWTRLFGPTELSAMTKSAEVASTAKYVTAQSAANGPAMFRREGASVYFDGGLMGVGYGNIRNSAAGLTGLAGKTIALLVYWHKLNTDSTITLRIGANTSNYLTYRWGADENLLQEGWNILLVNTAEAIGTNAVGQRHFQSGTNTGFSVAAGSYTFATQADYVAIEVIGMKTQRDSHVWVEGMYIGGRDKPRITIGFDIQTSGLDLAKSTMDKYGFKGYAAVPTANGNSAAPAYLWDSGAVVRLQSLYSDGWDIIQHSVSHNSMGLYSDEGMLLAEFEGCRQQLAAIGCTRAQNFFATPNGSTSNRVVALAAEAGVKWIRNVNRGKMLNSVGLCGAENPFNIGCFEMANRADTVEFQAYIDLLIQYGACGHLYTHGVISGASDSLNTNVTVFDSMMAYLKAKADAGLIEIVTPSKWLALSAAPNPRVNLALPSRINVVPGASPYSHINTGYEDMLLLVSGGTVSAIEYSRDGTTFDVTGETSGAFVISPGDRVRIAYTVAPTVVQLRA